MTCPTCKKPSVEQYRPFCSKRCADVDLGRWFSGAYTIEAHEIEEETADMPEESSLNDEDE